MNVLVWLTNYLVTYSFGKLEIWGPKREGELMAVDTGFRIDYRLIHYDQQEKKAKQTNTTQSPLPIPLKLAIFSIYLFD